MQKISHTADFLRLKAKSYKLKARHRRIILADFALWYYVDMPRLLVRAGRGYLGRTYFAFSMPLLVRTIFAPWRRDRESTQGLSLVQIVRVWIDNLLSRLIGAVIRAGTLLAGFCVLCVQGLGFGFIIFLWYGLPLLVILCVGYGLRLLLGGN